MARIYPNRPFRHSEVSAVDYMAYRERQRRQKENSTTNEEYKKVTEGKYWDEKQLRWV